MRRLTHGRKVSRKGTKYTVNIARTEVMRMLYDVYTKDRKSSQEILSCLSVYPGVDYY